MRQRRRYIAFEVVGAGVSARGLAGLVKRLAHKFPAEDPRASLKLIRFDESSRRGLLRCGHKQVEAVKGALAEEIGRGRARALVLGVSGTIKAARRKFLAKSPSSAASKL